MKYQKYKRSKRARYFRKQKIHGAVTIALGILSAIILEGDITGALLLVPLGLWLCLTKEAVITTDDYYYELEARKFDKWKDL